MLAAERLDSGNLGLANADRAVELARHLDRPLTELERDRVADLVTRSYVQRLTGMRVAAAVVSGRDPGPEASVGKLLATDTMARTSEVARMLLGPRARGRHRRLGHLGVDRAPARRPGLPHRRRHRRDPAQHPRRARARPAAGAAAR